MLDINSYFYKGNLLKIELQALVGGAGLLSARVRVINTVLSQLCGLPHARLPLSFTVSQSLLKLMLIESVMPSNHPVLHHPLLLLSSIFPSLGVFSSESAFHIRWPEYWSFSFSILASV